MFVFEQFIIDKWMPVYRVKFILDFNANFALFRNLKCVYMFYNSKNEVIYIGGNRELNNLKYLKQYDEQWFIEEVTNIRCFVFSPEENIDDHVLKDLVNMLKTKLVPHRNTRKSSESIYKYVEGAANKIIELSDKKLTGCVEYYNFKSIMDLNEKFVHHMILALAGHTNLEVEWKDYGAPTLETLEYCLHEEHKNYNEIARMYNMPERLLKRRIYRMRNTANKIKNSMLEVSE